MRKKLRFLRNGLSASVCVWVLALAQANPVDELPPGHWYEVPDSNLRQVLPDPLPVGDNRPGRPQSIMDEWSGGAYDSRRERLIVWGGGHNNYSGNELYVFDVAKLVWHRLTDPSVDVGGDEASGYYPDGLPRSRHTYDYVEYVPTIDRFCSFGGAAQFPRAYETNNLDCFDFETNNWETDAYKSVPKRRYESNINAVSAYDPETGYVYLHTTRTGHEPRLYRWKPVLAGRDKWVVLNDDDWIGKNLNAEIDSARRVMIAVGSGNFFVWKLKHPGRANKPKLKGDNEIVDVSAPGLAYHPPSGVFVAWHGGPDVYLLSYRKRHGWEARRLAPAAGNSVVPGSAPPVGTYGRFRYVASKDVFIAVNRINENVFFYRLPETANQ